MKILLINNFNAENRFGGVEHYLHELTRYAESNNSNVIFQWFGKEKIKTNWIEKFYHKKITQEIIQEIEDFKPDIIHCFSIGAPITPHFLNYAKLKGIPVVFSFRDYYYICPKNYMLSDEKEVLTSHNNAFDCILHHQPKGNILFDALLYFKQSYHKKIIKKHIDYFITPSKNLTDFIASHFQKNGKTLSNPILIENDILAKSQGKYILFVGRIVPEKGVLTLLKAFANILKEFPNEKLQIVGEGLELATLKDFAKKNNLNSVTFLGDKNRNELKEIYASSKFTVIPSEYLESYGNVIIESLTFGKTVITSDLVGIKDEIVKNAIGLTYPFKDQKQLEKHIITLLSNSELKKELENNIPTYLATKSFEKHYTDLLKVYENLLA
jgi:glycosyltransferase involved in cell wall biosynthesis